MRLAALLTLAIRSLGAMVQEQIEKAPPLPGDRASHSAKPGGGGETGRPETTLYQRADFLVVRLFFDVTPRWKKKFCSHSGLTVFSASIVSN